MLFNLKKIHVELSTKCMLKCPRCPRTELKLNNYINQEISIDQFRLMFSVSELKLVEEFIFCGHTGDPIYATDLLEIVEYIKRNSTASISIVTNGSYKKQDWWTRLGNILTNSDKVTFSVDGWNNDSNNQYRVNSNFDSILNGIKSLRSASECSIVWSTIYFSFNQAEIERIKTIAIEVGCDVFKTVKSSKFDGKYLNQYSIDPLKPEEHLIADSLVYDTYYEKINSRSATTSIPIQSVNRHPWAKCLNHVKELFVNVEGVLFPCPWFDGAYQSNEFATKHKERLNILNRSLNEVINDKAWEELLLTFDNNPLEICQLKCKNDGKQ